MKCLYSQALLPKFVNPTVPPTKKKPFSTILAHPFVRTVDLLLPEELYSTVKPKILANEGRYAYQRVNMRLLEILEGEFFNHYIKTGNILMLSEGQPGVDNYFTIREGVLQLELDRATYERCGLAGKPIQDQGKKHNKNRFVVELNLRLPCMLHGKKGFERIIWASKNVLNQVYTCLFLDLQNSDTSNGPIQKFHPSNVTVQPEVLHIENVKVPSLMKGDDSTILKEEPPEAEQLFEWISLAMLDSPRIRIDDAIDPFLSRYTIPQSEAENEDMNSESASTELVRLRWRAFISPKALTTLWVEVSKAVDTSWFAMGVSCFSGGPYLLLQNSEKLVHEWESQK